MSDKKDTRNVLTLEVKKFILSEREKQKTVTQIANSVYKEFSIRTSKSANQRKFEFLLNEKLKQNYLRKNQNSVTARKVADFQPLDCVVIATVKTRFKKW